MPVPRSLLPSGRSEILGLYKELLRHAQKFPSKKRDAIHQDIRLEFREKSKLSDPAAIAHALEVAVRGVGTMGKYTSLNKSSKQWQVKLEEDPLGQAEVESKRQANRGTQQTPPGTIISAGIDAKIGRLDENP